MSRAHAVRWLGTQRARLEDQARLAGMEVRTWSPGTGTTYYRFFAAGYAGSYHEQAGIRTCEGMAAARQFIVSRLDMRERA